MGTLWTNLTGIYVCASARSKLVELWGCNKPFCDAFNFDGRFLGSCLDWKRCFRLLLLTVKPGLPGSSSWVLSKNSCSHSAVAPRWRNDPKDDCSLYSHQTWHTQREQSTNLNPCGWLTAARVARIVKSSHPLSISWHSIPYPHWHDTLWPNVWDAMRG